MRPRQGRSVSTSSSRCGRHSRPHPAAPGWRRAKDLGRALRWHLAFRAEMGGPVGDMEAFVRARLSDGRIWFWEDQDGAPVALAGRNVTTVGVARIGPVYTPAEHRHRGYGEAVTAACTADALGRDAQRAVLFTDLDNPTTNALYQRIGYRPVRDHRLVRFANA